MPVQIAANQLNESIIFAFHFLLFTSYYEPALTYLHILQCNKHVRTSLGKIPVEILPFMNYKLIMGLT